MHLGIAALTVPEMALGQDEAHEMALALANLERHYNINPLSEKHMALFAFGSVMVRIYGKRVPAVLRGKPKSSATKPAASTEPVTNQTGETELAVPNVQDWFAASVPPSSSVS